jgi:transcriptional regulator with XRE-family HTH domain
MASKDDDDALDVPDELLPETLVTLGKNLKLWRDEAGFTQPDAAAFAGIPLVILQQAEQGKRELRATVLKTLAEVYGRSFGDAFLETDKQPAPDFSRVPIGRLLLHPRADALKRATLSRKFAELHAAVAGHKGKPQK